jgi:hypothetical protein
MANASQLAREPGCCCRIAAGFHHCRVHGWCGVLEDPDDLRWFLTHYPKDRQKILKAAGAQGVSESLALEIAS